jgi:CubicO group peptidase (beta-lactamase class C family)
VGMRGADSTSTSHSLLGLANELSLLARSHGVPGAQLAVLRGGDATTFELGELEHGSGRAVTPDAVFPIGSITKSFTATVAMLLVADGDLELDAPVREYLPALRELGDRITLRHLLSHTSGLASGPSSEELSTTSMWRYVVDHCHRRSAMLAPGQAFSYSNMGYILTGYLIEMITGMNWWEATESILLRPLGVTPAFVACPDRRPSLSAIASGHSVNTIAGRTTPVRQSLLLAEAPAGALALSARDLAALGALHLGGASSLLPAELAAEMRRPVPAAEPFGLADGWGLGLALFRTGETTWVGHDGNGDGTACSLRMDPVGGWVVAFTSNATTGYGMWKDLLPVLDRAGIPIGGAPPASQAPAIPPPWDCLGTYANGDTEYVVSYGAGGLGLAVDGDLLGQLTVHDDLVFSLRDSTTDQQAFDGRFLRDSSGLIDALQFGGRLARLRDRPVRQRRAATSR